MSELTASLVVGDPRCRRATFTRFVLPFAWEAGEAKKGQCDDPYFCEATPKDWLHSAEIDAVDGKRFLDRARRRYLTPETAELLFTRASWFVLKGGTEDKAIWKEFSVPSGLKGAKRAYKVALRPPALVLFEWPTEDLASIWNEDEKDDPLRIGFLIHEAFFPDPEHAPTMGDLLRFNEFFRNWRCPYPEYLQDRASEAEAICKSIRGDTECDGCPCDRPPDCFEIRWLSLLDHPVQIKETHFRVKRSRTEQGTKPERDSVFPEWMVNPDDRAFTLPFAVVQGSGDADYDPYQFEASSHHPDEGGLWAKVLNVDAVSKADDIASCTRFEKKWARHRTYTRWAHYRSLYGFSSHSFAVLCEPVWKWDDKANAPDLDGHGKKIPLPIHGDPPLALHFGQMYFDASLLHLYLRVGLFRFSARLHKITADARDKTGQRKEFEEWRERFHKLRWQFLQFENLYRFPLFSNQQQHLEMFELQSKGMDVAELYGEVDKEVRASDEYLENELAEERNRMAGTLNVVASLALVAALALSWMDAHSDNTQGSGWFIGLTAVFITALVAVLIWSAPITKGMKWLSDPGSENKGGGCRGKAWRKVTGRANKVIAKLPPSMRTKNMLALLVTILVLGAFAVIGCLSDSREKPDQAQGASPESADRSVELLQEILLELRDRPELPLGSGPPVAAGSGANLRRPQPAGEDASGATDPASPPAEPAPLDAEGPRPELGSPATETPPPPSEEPRPDEGDSDEPAPGSDPAPAAAPDRN